MNDLNARIEKRLASQNPAYSFLPKISAIKSQLDTLANAAAYTDLRQTASLLNEAAQLVDRAKTMASEEGARSSSS